MPSYNCGTEVDPFVAFGARVELYRVNNQASVDIDDVKKRCGLRTRIVYITPYFGWGQDLGDLRAWCREREIRIVEDCSLALFSADGGRYLGTESDAAVFSFRKSLPVPDGGALVLRTGLENGMGRPLEGPSWRMVGRDMAPFVKDRILRTTASLGLYPLYVKWRSLKYREERLSASEGLPDMPRDYYFDKGLCGTSISRISLSILSNTDPATVVRRRRENFEILKEELAELDELKPLLPTLNEGTCPLGYVGTLTGRDRVVQTLVRRGVPACPWWAGYHRLFDWKEFPEARYLKDHGIYLPVDQTLGVEQMHYMAACVRQAVREIK